MSAPLVVNTKDGMCWTRRVVTSDGIALYVPEGVRLCPEFVMATLPELAEHGIVGSAEVLPLPVGPEPSAREKERAAIAELIGEAKPATAGLVASLAKAVHDVRVHEHPTWEDLYCLNLTSFMGERMGPVLRRLLDAEARVVELEAERRTTNEALSDITVALREREAAPVTVFRAAHDSIVMGHYTTREAAKHHCEASAWQANYRCAVFAWQEDEEDGASELLATLAPSSMPETPTGYVVTPLEIASEYDEEADE
ncbi:hypothetical protein [Streptomyces bobili]|uniref:hypothetical protein n=1 Tax=Streptomyces bobili TaxID=67280 RepID=UPI0037A1EC96